MRETGVAVVGAPIPIPRPNLMSLRADLFSKWGKLAGNVVHGPTDYAEFGMDLDKIGVRDGPGYAMNKSQAATAASRVMSTLVWGP
jgi:hypothetical protein